MNGIEDNKIDNDIKYRSLLTTMVGYLPGSTGIIKLPFRAIKCLPIK